MTDNILWENILFYFLFLSQIILISFYFPRKMLKRIKYVLAKYPPEQYPNLYPKPGEYYEKIQHLYKYANLCRSETPRPTDSYRKYGFTKQIFYDKMMFEERG